MTMKIYVASSWRNEHQPTVVRALKAENYAVYDFRNPAPGNNGFQWAEIDPNWKNWNNYEYIEALKHSIANKGFIHDFTAMQQADACVLVLPSGRSSHVEAGWMQGAGKPVIVLLSEAHPLEPELMYMMFERVCTSIEEVIDHLASLKLINEVSLL